MADEPGFAFSTPLPETTIYLDALRTTFFRDTLRTIVFFFRDDRQFFAVGPTGGHLPTSQVAQWFTNTCLLDFAAFSPAFDYWTFLHLKVRNWRYILIVRVSLDYFAHTALLI